ncbi:MULTISPECIES: ABC transporter permease [Micromonospora]|uniref:ABC transporter permease subunit n=1 Tax=Micromonospora antibiotica TaxID=2807623 RepID=A0ABS3VFW1_9ACTN|nr:ABC transporter permease subunit [Micromonospora antibiotica]MBO4164439.1 ABC transporter permease subunit [Micromonospora antibiotica]
MSASGPSGDHLLRWRDRARRRGVTPTVWLVVPGALFMVVFFVYPVCYGVGLSFQGTQGWSSAYRDFFADRLVNNHGSRRSILITLELALAASVVNVVLAVPIAYRMRGRVRAKRALIAVVLVPMTLGTVFVASAMKEFLGPSGWLNRALLGIGAIEQPLPLVGNVTGVLLSLVFTGLPFAFLLMVGYTSGIDPGLDKAAAVCGARPAQRFWLVTFPLLLPGMTITFCLSFVLAFGVFPSATLVGNDAGPTRVLSKVAYTEYSYGHYPTASAAAVVMAVVQLAVLGLVLSARGLLHRGPTTGGKG